MAIVFPYTFASLSGNVPASDLDACFTYTATMAANATAAGSLSGAELVLLSQGGVPVGATIAQIAAATGIGTAAALGSGAQATGAQIKAGTPGSVALTPLNMAALATLASNGSYVNPGGFIFNWGNAATSGAGDVTVTFNTPFTTTVYGVFANQYGAVGAGNFVAVGNAITTAGFPVSAWSNSTTRAAVNIYWFAIGK